MQMITKTERSILNDMRCAATDMVLYDEIYRSFRKIRHDFANYIQSSSLESEDENFILRIRVLKKGTLEDTNNLLKRLEELPFDIESPDPEGVYPYLSRRQRPKGKMCERDRLLFDLWEKMKTYYIMQQQELSAMKKVLLNLQDRLERSLAPDEEESRIHLEECDSIKCHMTAENVLLAAFVYTVSSQCTERGADFRFRLTVPDAFKNADGDLFCLLSLTEMQAMTFTGLAGPLGKPVKQAGDETAGNRYLVRVLLASGMGLWHFSLECGLKGDADNEPQLLQNDRDAENLFENNKMIKKLLRKKKCTLSSAGSPNALKIDIVG